MDLGALESCVRWCIEVMTAMVASLCKLRCMGVEQRRKRQCIK